MTALCFSINNQILVHFFINIKKHAKLYSSKYTIHYFAFPFPYKSNKLCAFLDVLQLRLWEMEHQIKRKTNFLPSWCLGFALSRSITLTQYLYHYFSIFFEDSKYFLSFFLTIVTSSTFYSTQSIHYN